MSEYNIDEIREKVIKILDEKINPALSAHDGKASFSYFEDGILGIKFFGHCASCMANTDTLEGVIKPAILPEIEGITDIEIDNSVSDDLLEMARKILHSEGKFQ